jgi:hypothetical protein
MRKLKDQTWEEVEKEKEGIRKRKDLIFFLLLYSIVSLLLNEKDERDDTRKCIKHRSGGD